MRIAAHPNGTIYSAFQRWVSGSGSDIETDVVVTRDDTWGSGASPFSALVDGGDGQVGVRVATNRFIRFNDQMAQERLGSDLAIAVDPTDSRRVLVAWCDRVGGAAGTDWTIHVRRSTDSGQTWGSDRRTITNGKNPSLAVNARGRVGLLYQALTGTGASTRWETRLELTDDVWATGPSTLVLHSALTSQPTRTFLPYLGDYVRLLAVGKDFYGVFCGSNLPDIANFPSGVTYHRNANWTTHTLLSTDNATPVPVSIDPFYFHWVAGSLDRDVYVADWNDSTASHDTGIEPSSHAVFWTTSDVWNRQSNAAGGFNPLGGPNGQDARAGSGMAGNNYAFVRVRRNGSGSAANVTAHFLVSPFGTGSNFADAAAAADPVVPLGSGATARVLPQGYRWRLHPTSSTHLCLAVEISTADDPVAQPRLAGRAPGWPTDLLLVADNNKAQRNLGVVNLAGVGRACCYALVHNAATSSRDLELAPTASEGSKLSGIAVSEVSAAGRRAAGTLKQGKSIVLKAMTPGENRSFCLCFDLPDVPEGDLAGITLVEVVENRNVNGFTFQVRAARADAIWDALGLQVAASVRLEALLGIGALTDLEHESRKLRRKKPADENAYLALVRGAAQPIDGCIHDVLGSAELPDRFGLATLADSLVTAAPAASIADVVLAHGNLLRALDAYLTLLEKSRGDAADVLQNVVWQRDLFGSAPGLSRAADIVARSERFVSGWDARTVGPEGLAQVVQDLLGAYDDTVADAAGLGVDVAPALDALKAALDGDVAGLQREHRAFLLGLEALRS